MSDVCKHGIVRALSEKTNVYRYVCVNCGHRLTHSDVFYEEAPMRITSRPERDVIIEDIDPNEVDRVVQERLAKK